MQSKTDAQILRTIIKNPVFRQTVHPTYNAFRIENVSKTEAHARLNISADEKSAFVLWICAGVQGPELSDSGNVRGHSAHRGHQAADRRRFCG